MAVSPLYKEVILNEEEVARKDREKQERRIEKDMKERRLVPVKEDLRGKENNLQQMKEAVDAANLSDDARIQAIETRISNREEVARKSKEKAENERLAKLWKEQRELQQKRDRQAAEILRQRADQRAAEQRRQTEEIRQHQAEETRRWQNATYRTQDN